MRKFYKSKAFKALQDKWYKKLKKSGFDDIECSKPDRQDSRFLKFHSGLVNITYKPEIEEYFRKCRIHLENFKWGKRAVDKQLFTWYAEGVSYRSMMKLYRTKYRKKVSLFFIYYRINKMKAERDELKLWE